MTSLSMVHLNRCLEDLTTPTSATFPITRGFADTDYDEGDILDDLLLQDTSTQRGEQQQQQQRPRPRAVQALRTPRVTAVPDDSVSTCSSTTVADSFTDDNDNDNDGASSVTSVSVSGCDGGGGGGGGGNGRRGRQPQRQRQRQRQNRRGLAARPAFSSCASDAGSESPAKAARQAKLPLEKTETATKTRSQRTKKTKTAKPSVLDSATRARHPTLQIGLDLDVELQLKSKVRGDVCLTLVLEEAQKVAPRSSPEIRRNAAGQFVAYDDDAWENVQDSVRPKPKKGGVRRRAGKEADVDVVDINDQVDAAADTADVEEIEVTRIKRQRPSTSTSTQAAPRRELCHFRVGHLDLRRRWWMEGYDMISHIPPPVVAGIAVTMPMAGFAAGWVAANWTSWLW